MAASSLQELQASLQASTYTFTKISADPIFNRY